MVDIKKAKNISWQFRQVLNRDKVTKIFEIHISKENLENLVDTIDYLVTEHD